MISLKSLEKLGRVRLSPNFFMRVGPGRTVVEQEER